TITTVLQKNIDVLEDENKNTADFIFCVPEDMTRTY
ncbi:MAG: iron-regulated protein, partial [Bacteroidetes bacterium]